MVRLRHAADLAIAERAGDLPAGRGVAGDLDDHVRPESQAGAGHHRAPVHSREGEVLPDAPGRDRGPFRSEHADALEREETERPVGPAMQAAVALDVSLEPEGGDPGRRHRPLRHAPGGDVDLRDAGTFRHRRTHAAARLIIRFTVASSTTSPRCLVTSCREVTMHRSGFLVSRLSVMVTLTRSVSPSSTGATIRISPPRYDMPVPWMRPVCMMSPSESAKVMAPGAARRLNTDSLATYSMSMKSGSLKPHRFTNAQMSASETVRPRV